MNYLKELFAIPVGLKPIPIFGSLRLFTSDSLKKSYIDAMMKSNKLRSLSDKISKLVDDDIIIPCFLTKGIVSTILFKMFPTDRIRNDEQFFKEEMRKVFGFYEGGSKKIYILISNQINKLGFVNNDRLANTTIHESTHMASVKNPTKFMNTFRDILLKYYQTYFTQIFSLEGNNSQVIEEIINFLFKTFEKSVYLSRNNLKKYYNLIIKLKDASTSENFDSVLNDLFVTLLIFTKSTSQYIKNSHKFLHITNPLQTSYESTFGGKDAGNIPIQELLLPSEVIAIGTEITSDKKIINDIFRLL